MARKTLGFLIVSIWVDYISKTFLYRGSTQKIIYRARVSMNVVVAELTFQLA